jgi:hypothetical protein
MPDVKLKDVRDVVRPPKGYEWYSLDPKVNTPDPAAAVSSSSERESKDLPQNSPPIPRKERRRNLKELQQISAQSTPWGWWVAVGTVLIAVVVWISKKLMNRSKR